jgi:hypothetical protein
LSRERQKRRKDDLERVTKSYNELNIVVDPVIIHLELICLAVMTVSGYRRYPNGIWRKRRAMSDQCDQQIEINTIGDAILAAELVLQSTTENPFDSTKHIQDYLDTPD